MTGAGHPPQLQRSQDHLGFALCGGSDVIPLKFQRASGVLAHTFRLATSREIGPLDQLANLPVLVLADDGWRPYLVPIAAFPAEVEALAILADTDGECERPGRYIKIHSAYEAVVRPRDVTLSAVRHALAHPITVLTRPDVREALRSRFGGLRIDLSKYEHQKALYCGIGAMLVAIDITIYETFRSRFHELMPARGA